MLRAPSVAAALAVFALAGCLAPAADPADGPVALAAAAEWAARALPYGRGHDHHEPAHHAGLSTPNFELLGWDPLVTEHYGASAGGYLCGDAAPGAERRLAVVHSFTTEVSFVLVDVTDPAAPRKLSEMALGATNARDVAMTPDQRYVVVGASGVNRAWRPDASALDAPALGAPAYRSACTGGAWKAAPASPVGYPSGAVLVDIADPENPVVVDYAPLPTGGTHSIYATKIDGRTIVLASVLNVGIQPVGYFAFYTVEEGRLALQSVWNSVPVRPDPPVTNLHNDGWIHEHPATGQVIAYLADWDGGLVLLDVSDLRRPVEVGRWTNFRSDADQDDVGSIHTALVMDELWDGRHYVFAGQEILDHPTSTATGVIYVVDATDPAAPTPVAAWSLPVDVEWEDPVQFSTHYMTIEDRTLFVTMYHGGVWAVDVRDPASPRSVGVFVPANVSPAPPPHELPYSWSPTVMEAVALGHGELVLFDASSGAYVVRYDATKPAPLVPEWGVDL